MTKSKNRKLADLISTGSAFADGSVAASEVTGLGTAATAASTDFATAGQGTLAASALQPTGDGSGLTGIESNPFSPTTVSGVSQSLDLGSNNFFDGGTHTANSTITFTNAPTAHRFNYIYNSGIVPATSIAGVSQPTSTTGGTGQTKTFSEYNYISWDGLQAYGCRREGGSSQIKYYQITMSTAFDVSTATLTYEATSGGINDYNYPATIHLSLDGTKVYFSREHTGNWFEYATLSTPFALSTAGSFVELPTSNSWMTAMENLQTKSGMWAPAWSYDGTKYYSKNEGSRVIRQSTAGTAWDASTFSYANKSFDINPTARDPSGTQVHYDFGITFNQSGTRMYVLKDYMWEYALSTAYDISTASYVSLMKFPPDINGDNVNCRSGRFSADGSKFVGTRQSKQQLISLDMVTGAVVTFPTAVSGSQSSSVIKSTKVIYDIATTDGGTSYQILNEVVNNDQIYKMGR